MAFSIIYNQPSFLRLLPLGLTTPQSGVLGTEIATLGTLLDFTFAIKVEPTYPGAARGAVQPKYFETKLANNNRLSIPDLSTNINVLDESPIAEGGNEAVYGKFDCSVVCSIDQYIKLAEISEKGEPVIAIREIGKSPSVNDAPFVVGYEYLLGTIADLQGGTEEGARSFSFTVNGQVVGQGGVFTIKTAGEPAAPVLDYEIFNDAATGADNKITPHSELERTILGITESDFNDILCKGKVVLKKVS